MHLQTGQPGNRPILLPSQYRFLVQYMILSISISCSIYDKNTLRAAGGAVHDSVAAVEAHGIIQKRQSLFSVLISAVDDPAVSLLQHGRSIVVLRVPPITRAGGGAASAEDAFVETVQQLSLFGG